MRVADWILEVWLSGLNIDASFGVGSDSEGRTAVVSVRTEVSTNATSLNLNS